LETREINEDGLKILGTTEMHAAIISNGTKKLCSSHGLPIKTQILACNAGPFLPMQSFRLMHSHSSRPPL